MAPIAGPVQVANLHLRGGGSDGLGMGGGMSGNAVSPGSRRGLLLGLDHVPNRKAWEAGVI